MNPFTSQPVLDVTTPDTTTATFDASATPVLMEALYALYSDPVAAVTRELICNAVDSHFAAGQHEPVRVEVLDADAGPDGRPRCVLVVTDTGLGLDRGGLIRTFSSFGGSDKRETTEQIGGFGLGAKSAHAVTPTFTAEGVKDDRRTVAMMSLSPEGVSQVSILVNAAPTGSPNGVTVRVPMERSALTLAQAVESVSKWLPTGSVEFDGVLNVCTLDSGIRLSGTVTLVRDQTPAVVMGGVRYPLTSRQRNALAESLGNCGVPVKSYLTGLIITLPLGAVRPAPARESIRDTADTDAVLLEATRDIGTLVNALADTMDNPAPLIDTAPVQVTWRGIKTWDRGDPAFAGTVVERRTGSGFVLRSSNLDHQGAVRSRVHDTVSDQVRVFLTSGANTVAVVTDGSVEQVKYLRINAHLVSAGAGSTQRYVVVDQPCGYIGYLPYGPGENQITTWTFEEFRSKVVRPTRTTTTIFQTWLPGGDDAQPMDTASVNALSGRLYVVGESFARYNNAWLREAADHLGCPIVANGAKKPSPGRFGKGKKSTLDVRVLDLGLVRDSVFTTIPQTHLDKTAIGEVFCRVHRSDYDKLLDPVVRDALVDAPDLTQLTRLQRWALEQKAGATVRGGVPQCYAHLPRGYGARQLGSAQFVELANGLWALDQFRQHDADHDHDNQEDAA
ncbi:histidine kinase/DNA gyrase B/HSP90-like ATPase [Branchiibius hedensis]|uniref:Histidine kinase-, DNA gyrase B-, and HSP90-like ATPase n=1 Tax=Branchiibius hedensis TaxID=672460 RepID=A0A2Y8ZVY2_9MICO|nr:hypothetical protein [Branchiibius hedensis]PWJ25606.1 histidine kinase/DNA gyrase B/HSP90-like ATPase [Branchiibius hedensis]SSA34419.1 Histidine kinase-, DNA gyrase B-, and HSP90-like ATPase [Branchiibius hedensis]